MHVRPTPPGAQYPSGQAVAAEIGGFSTHVGGSRDAIEEIVGASGLEEIEETALRASTESVG